MVVTIRSNSKKASTGASKNKRIPNKNQPKRLRQPKQPRPFVESTFPMTLRSGTKRQQATDTTEPTSQPKKAKVTRPTALLSTKKYAAITSSTGTSSSGNTIVQQPNVTAGMTSAAVVVPPVTQDGQPEAEEELTIQQVLEKHILDMSQAKEDKNALNHQFVMDMATGATNEVKMLLIDYVAGINDVHLYTNREENIALNKLRLGMATYVHPRVVG